MKKIFCILLYFKALISPGFEERDLKLSSGLLKEIIDGTCKQMLFNLKENSYSNKLGVRLRKEAKENYEFISKNQKHLDALFKKNQDPGKDVIYACSVHDFFTNWFSQLIRQRDEKLYEKLFCLTYNYYKSSLNFEQVSHCLDDETLTQNVLLRYAASLRLIYLFSHFNKDVDSYSNNVIKGDYRFIESIMSHTELFGTKSIFENELQTLFKENLIAHFSAFCMSLHGSKKETVATNSSCPEE